MKQTDSYEVGSMEYSTWECVCGRTIMVLGDDDVPDCVCTFDGGGF